MICRKCNGTGWWGSRSATFGKGGYCSKCGGSGEDPNWKTTPCKHCGTPIEYNIRWTHLPEYCQSCRSPQFKSCEGCGGSIEYKVFWTNLPKYCPNCKDWKVKYCKCGAEIQYKSFWTKVPDWCKSCMTESKYKPCAKYGCPNQVEYKAFWDHPPSLCKSCKEEKSLSHSVTKRSHDGKPDHTTYSYGGLRRSFDTDQGENVRNDHFSENGEKGSSVDRG